MMIAPVWVCLRQQASMLGFYVYLTNVLLRLLGRMACTQCVCGRLMHVVRSVVSACVSLFGTCESCENGWTDRCRLGGKIAWARGTLYYMRVPGPTTRKAVLRGSSFAGPWQRSLPPDMHARYALFACPAPSPDDCFRRREQWQDAWSKAGGGDAASCQITPDTRLCRGVKSKLAVVVAAVDDKLCGNERV